MCRLTISLFSNSSSRLLTKVTLGNADTSVTYGSKVNIFTWKPDSIRARCFAIFPKPRRPTVFPSNSRPWGGGGQAPALIFAVQGVNLRRAFRMCSSATSATEALLAPSTLATKIPSRAAASRSMLSRPMPNFWIKPTRPLICSRVSSFHGSMPPIMISAFCAKGMYFSLSFPTALAKISQRPSKC